MMKDDVFIASLVQYGFLDQVYSRIKNELRYLPDMNELRMVVSAGWTGIGNHQYPQAQFTCNIP